MKNKNSALIFIIVILIVGGAIGLGLALGSGSPESSTRGEISSAVTLSGGQQTIDITAKGGYSPRVIEAKANIPTILRVSTNGTYDCSSSLVIPKIGWRGNLDSTGVKEIAIAADQAQGTLQGLCGMGMYSFKVNFN